MNEELIKRIDLLAEKLNTTGEHIWQAALYQTRIDMFYGLAIDAVAIVGAYFLLVFIRKQRNKPQGENESALDMDFRRTVSGIAFAIPVLIAFVVLLDLRAVISAWINPDFYAIQLLLEGKK